MSAKFIFEKLPLEKDDILLVTLSEKLSDDDFEIYQKVFTALRETLPHKNLIVLAEFGITVQALRPLQGQFKIVNDKITIVKEKDLLPEESTIAPIEEE